MPPLPLRRRLLFAAVPPLALLAAAWAAGEVWLRGQFRSTAEITGVTPWRTDRWGDLAYHWDAYDPLLGWTNRPGYASDERVPFRVTIDERGLRPARKLAVPKPPGVRRVALFGDSCAFGEEVDDGVTVTAHLERRLDRTEALNYGVHGYSFGQMVLRLEREGFDLDPDHVIVLLLLPSDLARDPLPEFSHPKPVFRLDETGRLVVENVPVPEASRLPWVVRRSYALAWLFARAREPVGRKESEDLATLGRRLLARAAAACAERGVPLTVATIVVSGTLDKIRYEPEGERRLHRRLVAALRDEAAAAPGRVDVIDLFADLAEAYARHGRILCAPRGHWSGPGNCLIAERLARHLAQTRPDIFRVRPDAPPCLPDR